MVELLLLSRTTTMMATAVYHGVGGGGGGRGGQQRGTVWRLLLNGLLLVALLSSVFYYYFETTGSGGGGSGDGNGPPLLFDSKKSIRTRNGAVPIPSGGPRTGSRAKNVKEKEEVEEDGSPPPPPNNLLLPEVAWLMSFGGSGTSYTIGNTESLTGTTTATNYGRDLDPCVPLRANWTDGPFLHRPPPSQRHHEAGATKATTTNKLPPRYILTKTHCGAYCMDCRPSDYVLSVEAFALACRAGTAPPRQTDTNDDSGNNNTHSNTQLVKTAYGASVPRRAVHVLRNPFDNLVARMHLGVRRKQRLGHQNNNSDNNDNITAATAPSSIDATTPRGFEEWCRYLDNRHAQEEEASVPVLKRYADLPCRAEWYRYVQWHNRAEQVTADLRLPVHYLYFENYTAAWNETVDQLMDFLEFEPDQASKGSPVPFVPGKTYFEDYYAPRGVRRAAEMVRELASPQVWALLRHYFPAEESPTTASSTSKDERGEAMMDVNHNKALLSTEGRTEVAWLLSFPNSGTSYTIMNAELLSNASTSSNYALDFEPLVPVRSELAGNGPYLHRPDLPLAASTLSKTHCTGYCVDCPPDQYVHTSVESFERGCRSGVKQAAAATADNTDNDNGTGGKTAVKTVYDVSVVTKAVHLIRNPFDNVLARMHLTVKLGRSEPETLAAFTDTKEGLAAWCQEMDTMYPAQEMETDLISPEVKELWKDLPCRSDWFRWVQWHNLALEVTKRRRLPVFYLYYEDYGEKYEETVKDLFDFLGLSTVAEPVAFIPGKTYLDLYDDHTIRTAARFVEGNASPECWELVKRYFL